MSIAALMKRLEEIGKQRERLDVEECDVMGEVFREVAEAWNREHPEGIDGEPINAEDLVMPKSWECEGEPPSPTGFCIYDDENDPPLDFCLFCGEPDERK